MESSSSSVKSPASKHSLLHFLHLTGANFVLTLSLSSGLLGFTAGVVVEVFLDDFGGMIGFQASEISRVEEGSI